MTRMEAKDSLERSQNLALVLHQIKLSSYCGTSKSNSGYVQWLPKQDFSGMRFKVELTPREHSRKITIAGIFPGAKVIRGQNWDWGDQDGGLGHVGNVTDIRGWDKETDRSVANVSWIKTGVTNVYRVGHKGKVDIRCQNLNSQPRPSDEVVVFNPGDKVKVNVDEERLKSLQDGHGGWNPRMVQYIGEIGIVHRVTDKGGRSCATENCSNRWTFHPAALVKVNRFKVGDSVRILNDVAKVQELQKGHGEWLDIMAL
ncbi:unnamed protein product, partial [Ilex paraguariensis]